MNCFNRANVCAGTAVGTYIGIYLIDITFRNSINRAFVNAAAACSAIVIDYVSHFTVFFGS